MKSVETELKRDASELMSAAIIPATTRPRKPTGRSDWTSVGNTLSPSITFAPSTTLYISSWNGVPFTVTLLCQSAKPSMPGTRKRNTGQSFSAPPQIAPRRAFVRFFAASVRWTMNWSVHQYQTPIVADATTTPSHGNTLWESECQRPNGSTLSVALIVCLRTAQPSPTEAAVEPSPSTTPE